MITCFVHHFILYKYKNKIVAVLTGHLADHGVEVGLVLVVDEAILKHTLTLVTEETEDLVLILHCARLTLQHA